MVQSPDVLSIRKRPSMYVGSTETFGLHSLLWEVVGNSIDEHMSGHARTLLVEVGPNRFVVQDDGRGIAFEFGTSGVEASVDRIFTKYHSSGTADGHSPHIHFRHDFHGAGLVAVCALSEELHVAVRHMKGTAQKSYRQGEGYAFREGPDSSVAWGTRLSVKPDPSIFKGVGFDIDLIFRRLQELAYLSPGLRLVFNGELLQGGDGLGAYCRTFLGSREQVGVGPLRIRAFIEEVDVDIALTWVRSLDAPIVRSFVSHLETIEHGTHVEGFWRGLKRAVTSEAGDIERVSAQQFRDLVGRGLVCIIHAGLNRPKFGGPTRAWLASPEARRAVSAAVSSSIPVYLAQFPELRARLTAGLRSP